MFPPKGFQVQAETKTSLSATWHCYGATSGKAFINGVAGERFCVRNSGASAVVEGVGEHGCEYMTGGCAVILGEVGKNFAAGMSGGIAYVLDRENDLYTKLNKSLVGFGAVTKPEDVAQLKGLIEEHVAWTDSKLGKKILKNFDTCLPHFKKIVPHDYAKMLDSIAEFEAEGMSREEAQIDGILCQHEKLTGGAIMGKSTGFLEYERVENAGQEPLERIKTYREFHTPLSDEERRKQGARCMDCGVPFCQAGKPIFGMVSGCPLNNLCPEWNDMVYNRLLGRSCGPAAADQLFSGIHLPGLSGAV